MSMELHYEISQFLYLEADIIDERRFSEWMNLLTEDICYVLLGTATLDREMNQAAEANPLPIIEENLHMLDIRVRRLGTKLAHAEQPPSRTRHLITNIRVVNGKNKDEVIAYSNFLVYRSRLEYKQELFPGKREDLLRRVDGTWKIASRKVVLDLNLIPGTTSILF